MGHEVHNSKPNMNSSPVSLCETSEKISQIAIPTLSAIILAGGEGRRMGGLDKGLVHYQNKPLVQWVKEALPCSVNQIIISCNRHMQEYAQYGQTIHDSPSEYTYGGALSGIIAGLSLCINDWVIITPCDLINYPTDFAIVAWQNLSEYLKHYPYAAKIAVAYDGERRQNLCLLLHKDEAQKLSNAQQISRSVHYWLDDRQALNIPWADKQAFLNINDQNQLAVLKF
jgi:molybdopterin-guanine dinucleotide biosynthesis protein A